MRASCSSSSANAAFDCSTAAIVGGELISIARGRRGASTDPLGIAPRRTRQMWRQALRGMAPLSFRKTGSGQVHRAEINVGARLLLGFFGVHGEGREIKESTVRDRACPFIDE